MRVCAYLYVNRAETRHSLHANEYLTTKAIPYSANVVYPSLETTPIHIPNLFLTCPYCSLSVCLSIFLSRLQTADVLHLRCQTNSKTAYTHSEQNTHTYTQQVDSFSLSCTHLHVVNCSLISGDLECIVRMALDDTVNFK